MIFLLHKVPPSGAVFVRSSNVTWTGAGGEQFEASIISICKRNGSVSAILPKEPRDVFRGNTRGQITSGHDGGRTRPVVRREWTTLTNFRKQVDACSQVRKPLTEIENIPDPKLRAARVIPYLTWTGDGNNDAHLIQRHAFGTLTGCGAAAIPHLRALLRDGTCTVSSQENIVRVMAAGGPKSIGPVFVDILEEDLKFWKALEGDQDKDHTFGNRYKTGRLLIRYFALMGVQASRETIQQTLEFWQSAPADLEMALSHTTMAAFCEAALKALDARAKRLPIGNDIRVGLGLRRRFRR